MIFFIGYSTDSSCSLFARQNFYIIVCSLTASTGFRAIESRTIQWHGINIDLIGTTAITCAPCVAAIVSRPLLTDVRAIFCRNSKTCILLRRRIFPAPTTTITVELNVVNISLILDVYDCGAVTGNSLLGNGLRGKTVIFFRRSFRFRTCFALLGFSFLQRIAVVICIFLPMDNGVFRFGIGFPVCGDGSRFGNRCDRVAVCVIPTVKRVAVAGRHLRKRQCFARFAEYGLNIAAAVSIELDPEAVFDNRINHCDDFVFCKRNRSGFTVRHCAPTNNVTFGIQHKVHCVFCRFQIRRADSSLRFALSRIANRRTVLVHEVHIANILKLRRKFYGRTAGYGSNFAKTFKEIVSFIVPPNKTCIVFFGCSRLEELFAFGDGLRPIGQLLAVCIIETVGIDRGLLVVVRKQHSG